ncbi:MAG TPA: SRPBCC family protein [Dehalococcoidia bacterium]|nr:SRPBCC family protein [Dehalococcoidia bacterium]
MAEVSKSIEIAAPRERVFQEATDPAKQGEWALFLKDVAVVSGDKTTPGSKQVWQFKVGPRAQPLEAVITRFIPNEHVARRAEGAINLEESMAFVAVDDTATRVHWNFEYQPPLGPIGRLLDTIFVNRVFQNDVETSLENLKRRLEV